MNKKKKILFYGNCQMGAISEIFRTHSSLKDKFIVLNASDYDLVDQGYPAVANFLLSNEFSKGKNDPWNVEKIFSDADIVVFHALDNNKVPEYCLTKNIIPNFKGLSICIPSFWYSGYFGWPYKFPMFDLFYYFNQLDISNKEALHLLLNEPIPITEKLFAFYHDYSIDGLKVRSKEQAEIYNYIPILHWLRDTCKNKLLCYNHSHPTPAFFEFIVNQILHKIDTSIENINLKNFNFKHAGADSYFLPTKFRFFNDLFPDIDPLSSLEISKYNASNQPEIFVNKGMKYIKDNKVFDSRRGLIADTKIKTILGVKS